ncbi:hypothetical protein [Candidatus Electronema sp. PJ]|uniref:hypothetical protein n=1 Tax=Candidatus Electronema sp. PJ TaxID=3401572 RepID=UPI003AA949BB
MKRIFLFLLICLVTADAIYCIVLRPRQQEVMTFLATRLPSRQDLVATGQSLLASPFVRHLVSGDWLKPQPIDPIELVPENALLMLDTENAVAAGQALLNSRFGQTVAAINWPTVLEQLGVPPLFRLVLEQQVANVAAQLANPLLQDIFSRRTVAAFLPPENPQQLRDDPLRTLLEQTLLLAAPKENTAAALLALVKAAAQQPALLYHQGMSILVFDLNQGRKLHVAVLGDSLAFSLGLQPVQQSIEVFARHFFFRRNGLLRSRDYAELKAEAQGKEDLFFYADLARLHLLLNKETAAAAFRSLSLFHQRDGEAVQFKVAVRFTPDQLPPLQKEFFTVGPTLNRTLGKMPASLPLYFWSSWLDPNFWQQALSATSKQDSTERMEAWFKAQTDLSLSEILALFGQEFSVNLAEISTGGFFPVPRLCFILEVRDQEKTERLLARLISDLPVKRDKVADGTAVVSLQVAQGMLQPSYAFADGFLLLADSREQLVDILEGKTERMAKSKAFQAAAAGMEQPSNLMLFVRAAQLVDGLKELAAWAGTMTAISDEQAGAKSKVLIDQIITPLLDSLSACGAVSLRSVVRPGELVIEAAALHAEEEVAQAVEVEN